MSESSIPRMDERWIEPDGRPTRRFFRYVLESVQDADGGGGAGSALSDGTILVGDASDVAQEVAVSGDATLSNTGVLTIATDAVTFAKMQEIATNSLIGRDTALTGNPETILLNATLSMDGAGNLRREALTGDVTASAGSNATTIPNDTVTFAKMQNITDARLLGRSAGSDGDMQHITVGTGLTLAAGNLTSTGSGGDITGPVSVTDLAIARWDGTTGNLLQDSSAFVDDNGRVLTGSATAQLIGLTPSIQALGTTTDTTSMGIGRWSNDAASSNFIFAKARGASIGTNSIVQSGDAIGGWQAFAANGSTFTQAAGVFFLVDGTPGASDMPGRIEFYTTPDGQTAAVLRATIKNTGTVLVGTATETAGAGRIQLGSTGDTTATGGICFGTDTQIFRSAASTLTIPDNMVLGGAANTITVTGTPAGQVIGSTYSPTRSAEANLDANVTMSQAQYMRVGATVTVSGAFTADPTAPGAASFEFTLPVASNIGAVEDVAGVAFAGGIAGQGAAISGSVANNTAVVSWIAVDVTSQAWSYQFSYQVL